MGSDLTGSDLKGRCLCGAVTFRGQRGGDALRACHCGQCRRWSGHVWAAIGLTDLRIAGPVRWHASSDRAERGFCSQCGSALFWKARGGTETDVAAGALDAPTGLELAGHIFAADKGDYYRIADDLPTWPQEAPE
ncbi:GFA family protein [Paracoccus liaowanqingii]|uniref:GFA family protein n=1 Tax=Paracoccus liaowanqingii TaxID=2560053 RepID=A0A4P7HI46_9RHOB|nr:GFA family protein [Paracoccus liaowanqingii]QBX33323.1 GFA family protein [Paracoccus liaowanqingii]